MKYLYTQKDACCGCGACAYICPKDAIQMYVDWEGFRYPRIRQDLCIDCKKCQAVCPLDAAPSIPADKNRPEHNIGNQNPGRRLRRYLGVQAKEPQIRCYSSSGGIFPVLAEYVLEKRGVVYGAAYGRHMRVVHREIDSMDKLDSIKRTKYVQSSLKGIFRKVKAQLEKDRWVLFCGTPCQTQAIRLCLKKFYPKLILADLVCYGTPSPGIWDSYVSYLEQKHRGQMTSFSFRDKRMRDNGHTCSYVIDGKEYAGSLYNNLFCRMYFSNHILRPSCHSCRFCTTARDSDFTIGDFWGVENVHPEMDDGMGTSMVILHTEKANEIWESIKDRFTWFECREQDVLQPRLTEPTKAAANRRIFMTFYRMLPFSIFQLFYRAVSLGMTRIRTALK